MWWPWRRRPVLPAIPAYPPLQVHPVAREEPGIVVDEVDTSQYTRTGVYRVWDRMTGKLK